MTQEDEDRQGLAPCLRCGYPVAPQACGVRVPCPNCGHMYPNGDCSD